MCLGRKDAGNRLVAWNAAMSLEPAEFEALELGTRHEVDLGQVLGLSAGEAQGLLTRAALNLERALGAEVLARRGRPCPDRAEVLAVVRHDDPPAPRPRARARVRLRGLHRSPSPQCLRRAGLLPAPGPGPVPSGPRRAARLPHRGPAAARRPSAGRAGPAPALGHPAGLPRPARPGAPAGRPGAPAGRPRLRALPALPPLPCQPPGLPSHRPGSPSHRPARP